MKKKVLDISFFTVAIALFLAIYPFKTVMANETAWMPDESQPIAYMQKDIFETETVKIKGLTVQEIVNDTVSPMITTPIEQKVTFKLYNSTKQEMEQTVQSENGKLPDLYLIKDHNYIIFAEDPEYRMPNQYVWVKGKILVDIKQYASLGTYPPVENLNLYKRDAVKENPEDDRRVMVNLSVKTTGGALLYNVDIKLVSDVETISVNTGNKGKIQERLLEDVNYAVEVDHASYGIASIPVVVKDKSEFDAGKYTYDHSSCGRLENLIFVNKKDVHKNDTLITNKNYENVYKDVYTGINGTTTVEGMKFNDLLVIEQKSSRNIDELAQKDYEVYDIKLVNPHRWEVTKLAVGEFKITKEIEDNKKVKQVYEYIDDKLQKIEFTQDGNEVCINTNSISLYPIVIEYEKDDCPFTDIKESDFFFYPVQWAVKEGITTGKTATTFEPLTTCTRAQAITFLWRAAGKPEPESTVMPFEDVEKGKYYEKAVLWAVEEGITTGVTEKLFCPDRKCTRSQIVTFLWKYQGKPEPESTVIPFEDVEKGKYYEKAVLWAVENEITLGKTSTTFSPDGNCTRGQIVTFLYRCLK